MAIQTIPSTLIADNAISAAKIAAGVISADDISNNSITAAKLSASTSPTFADLTTTGTINGLTLAAGSVATSTSQNFALNTPNSLRINIDSNDSATDQVFVIGKNQTAVDASNDVLFKIGENGRTGIGLGAPNANLHVGSSNATGDATNPAIQIGGASTYRLGMYTTSEGAIIDNANGDDGIIFHTKTAGESMRITSDGDVGIGTTTPRNLSGQNSLTINGSVSRVDFKISNTFRHAIITEAEYLNLAIDPDDNQSNSRFIVSIDNSEKLRIDSSGLVSIGTTSAHDSNALLTLSKSAVASSVLKSTTNTVTFANVANGSSSVAYSGTASNHPYYFMTNGSERMRIQTNGGVEIGDGTNYGYVKVINDSAVVQYLDRRGTDGIVLEIRHADSKDGQINTLSGRMAIGSDDTGIFFDSTRDCISPFTMTGNDGRDSAIDIGRSGVKFKDVYLSGGIQFDSRTNKLDDYEEGTWTPTIHSSGGNVSASYSYRSAYYIKIGNAVWVRWGFRLSSISGGSGTAEVTGLPFTSKSYGGYQQPAAFTNTQNLTTDPDGPVLFYIRDNTTELQGRLMNNADTVLPISHFQNGSWCIGNVIYDVS